MKISSGFILSSLILLNACQAPNTLNTINSSENIALVNSQVEQPNKEIVKKNFEEIYGNYKLSNIFMKKLNSFVSDKVLNKTEINNLFNDGTETERNFIKIIENKESFTMTNLKSNASDADELSFVVNKDFSVTGDFIKKIGMNLSDNLLDKIEINNLNKEANTEEKAFLSKIGSYDSYNYFPFIDLNNKVNETNIKIYYDENQTVQGESMLDILSNIGQSDRLSNTYNDQIRCGAGVVINSVLLTKGKTGFYDLSKKLGLNINSLTYENIHLTQEKLMDKVSGSKGLSISKNIEKNHIIGGSLIDALNIAGLKWSIDAVKKVNGTFQDDINNYFKTNSNGVIILTGSLDKDLKKMVFDKNTDHSALLSYKNNKFIITDTSGRNGSGLNNIELNDKDLNEIYTSNQTFVKIII